MIRTRKIIAKDYIFDVIADPSNAKVEVITSHQKYLKDQNACDVHIYKKVEWNTICSVIGMCEKATSSDITKKADFDLVKGLVSMKGNGFLKLSQLNKLVELEKEYKYSFGISKSLKAFIKTI